MFCPKCGQNVPDGVAFCPNCGAALNTPEAAPRPQYEQPAAPMYQQPAAPVYQQPAAPQYQQPATPQSVYVVNNNPAQPQPAPRSNDQYLLRYSGTVRARGIVALIFSTLIWIPFVIAYAAIENRDEETLIAAGIMLIIAMIMLIPGFIVSIVGLSSALRFRRQYGSHNGNSVAGLIMSVIALVISSVMLIIIITGLAGGTGFLYEIFDSL